MITLKAPDTYRNEPGILSQSGSWIADYGNRAFIIGGKRALNVVGSPFFDSLKASSVAYTIQEFSGTCILEEIDAYVKQAREGKGDVIIGVGGGKALDVSKAVAEKLHLPVVTVPTIAATCAAWSALTVLYDREGRTVGYLPLEKSPSLVLADTKILAAAPKRYIAAGIGDTLVKWYEVAVNLKNDATDLDVRIGLQPARLALDILHEHALSAYASAGTGEVTPAFQEISDAIILLAGLAGSVKSLNQRVAIAHGIHDRFTQLTETHQTLHGEKVAFGLLIQLILEGRDPDEVRSQAFFLHQLGLPVTLKELGITDNQEESAIAVAEGFSLPEGTAAELAFSINEVLLAEAILQTDQIGQQVLEEMRL